MITMTTTTIQTLINEMRKAATGWLIYSCVDGTYDSQLVIGSKEDCKLELQNALWYGDFNEIPEHVTDTLKSFMDPENWGMDYGEWKEEGEQYYIGVKRVCGFAPTSSTNQARLEKALTIAVEALIKHQHKHEHDLVEAALRGTDLGTTEKKANGRSKSLVF